MNILKRIKVRRQEKRNMRYIKCQISKQKKYISDERMTEIIKTWASKVCLCNKKDQIIKDNYCYNCNKPVNST